MKLTILPNKFAVCRLDPDRGFPNWAFNAIFYSITASEDELSVVTLENQIPLGIKSEPDWRVIKVIGPLDFSLTGVLSSIAEPLAEVDVSIFALSTFDTDYILVKHDDLEYAKEVLINRGFNFVEKR